MTKQELKNQIIQFYKKYYKIHNEAPSLKKVFKHFKKQKLYNAKYYDIFPRGQAEACKLAEIPIQPKRLAQTRKAWQTAKKKRLGETEKEVTPLQDLKQSYETQHEVQQREEQRREEFSQKLAEEIAILLQDPNEATRRLIVNAIEEHALPVLLETKYGIEANVPEILAMLKEYKKAVDEGWDVDFAMEWGVLSEEGREKFGDICNMNTGGTIGLPDYLSTLKDEIESLIEEKNGILQKIAELEKKRRSVDYDYRRAEYYYSSLKTKNAILEENYEKREKQLNEQYNRKWREYAAAYEKAKTGMILKIGKLLKENQRLEMANKKLRDLHNPVKRLSSKRSYGEIDFTKLRDSLGFPVSVSKKEKV